MSQELKSCIYLYFIENFQKYGFSVQLGMLSKEDILKRLIEFQLIKSSEPDILIKVKIVTISESELLIYVQSNRLPKILNLKISPERFSKMNDIYTALKESFFYTIFPPVCQIASLGHFQAPIVREIYDFLDVRTILAFLSSHRHFWKLYQEDSSRMWLFLMQRDFMRSDCSNNNAKTAYRNMYIRKFHRMNLPPPVYYFPGNEHELTGPASIFPNNELWLPPLRLPFTQDLPRNSVNSDLFF